MKRLTLLGRALFVYAVAVLLRLRNLKEVLVGDRVLFGFDDPYYHLRRVFLTLQHFPKVPGFDYYVNYPSGAVITWPPGFDLLVATVCWISGLGHPSPHRVEAVAAVLMPFLGGAAALVTLLMAEEILGRARWEAFGAALLFAFLPAQQAVSTVGRLDHHVVEISAFGCAVLFFLRALRDDPGSRYSFWGGVALAAGTYCWTGSILYGGFLVFFALTQMILDRVHGRGESSSGRSALRVMFWGSLLLVPLVLLAPAPGNRSFTYLLFSWYQPALLGIATFLLPALYEIVFAGRRKRAVVVRVSGGALAVGLLLALAAWILHQGSGGFQFLTRRDRIIGMLVESIPVWKLPAAQLVFYFTPLLYVAPIAVLFLVRRAIRDRFHDARMNCLLAFLAFTAVLGASQARFLNYFAMPYCITLLWALRRGLEALTRRMKTRAVKVATTTAGVALFLFPLEPTIRDSFRSLPGNVDMSLARIYPTLEWMRDKTPETSFYLEPDRKPEYGVLADFTFGHWITAIGRRPNYCNPFSLASWHEKPIFESAKCFLLEEESEIASALDRNEIRYVLLYNNESAVPDYAKLAGKEASEYINDDPVTGRHVPTPRFFRTFGVRLALADDVEYAAAGQTVPALGGFRLVHESPEARSRSVPGMESTFQSSYVKVFERVKGVVLEGKTMPGSTARLKMTVTTNTGRSFEYRASAAVAQDGTYRFVVPYATEVTGDVVAGPAVIEAPQCHAEIVLSEAEVVAGALHQVRCR